MHDQSRELDKIPLVGRLLPTRLQQRFLLMNLAFLLLFFSPLKELLKTYWNDGTLTYIPMVPIISAFLIYNDRNEIFSCRKSSNLAGYASLVTGMLLFALSGMHNEVIAPDSSGALTVVSLILVWVGGFIIVHGMEVTRKAAFPLLFLLFAVPIPEIVMDHVVTLLQRGSAEISYCFINASGIPVDREGFVFHLPALDIEVAKECSGIRSFLSLVILGALTARYFLRTWWTRGLLLLSLVPVAIIKNAFRIFSLSFLSISVDIRVLESDLHRKGGVLFFLLAIVLSGGIVVLLRKIENRHQERVVSSENGQLPNK